MRRIHVLSALFVVCILMAGCGGDSGGGYDNRGSNTPPRNPSGGGGGRPPVQNQSGGPLFRLPASDGQPVTVRAPAALFFYTSWCGYCKQVLPEVKRLTNVAQSRGWSVYGIQVAEGPSQVNGYIQQYQPNFPVLMDQQSVVANKYGIKGYPTFILIDESGKIVYNGHEPPRGF